jgi:Zn finger protein HypA/HybF involved in hydrogenase expression
MKVLTYCVPDHTPEDMMELMIETLETTIKEVISVDIGRCSKIETHVPSVALNITVDDNIVDDGILLLGSIIGSLICTRCLGE